VAVKDSLTQYEQDDVLRKEFKQDLRKYIEQLHGLESQIKKTEQEREKAKNAIQTFQEFIELFQNLAQHIRNLKNMSDLDFVLKKLFSNFLVDGKKVLQITQNSPFRELCGSPNSENSVMVWLYDQARTFFQSQA
jgi:vacuolar-type H+-ATPase subunit I/STV1